MVKPQKDLLQGLFDNLSEAVVNARKERDDSCDDLMHYSYVDGIIEGYQFALRRVWEAMAAERGEELAVLSVAPDGSPIHYLPSWEIVRLPDGTPHYPEICQPE